MLKIALHFTSYYIIISYIYITHGNINVFKKKLQKNTAIFVQFYFKISVYVLQNIYEVITNKNYIYQRVTRILKTTIDHGFQIIIVLLCLHCCPYVLWKLDVKTISMLQYCCITLSFQPSPMVLIGKDFFP